VTIALTTPPVPCVLKVLDVLTGQPVFEHREGQEIFACAFSADGKCLAFGLADGSVKIADATSGDVIALLGKHDDPIAYGSLQFRYDGLRLASASLDGTARIWNLTAALRAPREESAAVVPSITDSLHCRMSSGDPVIALWSVAYSPDGQHVITGDNDGQLVRWNAETGAQLDTKDGSSRGAYLSVAYGPNGRWIVSASEDCTARVYDAQTMELVKRFRGHLGPIRTLAITDDLLITGSTDSTVRVWDLKQVEENLKK
jgi:WD40 repeat protein